MYKSIVWATDGSENADAALEQVRMLAEAGRSQVRAVHVKELMVGRAAGYPVRADADEIEKKIRSQVQELGQAGIDADLLVVEAAAGGAAHQVADAAKEGEADLIIVGTRGHGPVAGLLLGSVTHRLLHVAPCPVLAIPPP